MDKDGVFRLVRKLAKDAGSQSALAIKLEMSGAYLSDVLNENRPLSDDFLEKVGLERVTTYRRRNGK